MISMSIHFKLFQLYFWSPPTPKNSVWFIGSLLTHLRLLASFFFSVRTWAHREAYHSICVKNRIV